MARVLHRVDVAQLAPGHRLIMQVRQYTLPLWPFWRLPMDGVCIQILPIPHNFHDLRPFGRKPCIAGGNFGGMSIHLCTIAVLLTKHIPPRHHLLNPIVRVAVHRGHSTAMPLQPPPTLMPQALKVSSPPTSPYFASAVPYRPPPVTHPIRQPSSHAKVSQLPSPPQVVTVSTLLQHPWLYPIPVSTPLHHQLASELQPSPKHFR